MKRKVLFAGLGNMGLPMARNLKNSGRFDVFGFDVSEERLKMAENLVS